MTRPGDNSMLGRALLGATTETIQFANFNPADADYLDWVAARQGDATFETSPGGSSIEGGARILDFGLPAYQFTCFLLVQLGAVVGDAAPLEVDITGLLDHFGLNGIQAGEFLPIGHASIGSSGENVGGLLHVVSRGIGTFQFIDQAGDTFATPIDGTTFSTTIEMMLDFQATND